LIADCELYRNLPQPLVVPLDRLSSEVKESVAILNVYDFGLSVCEDTFKFNETSTVTPSSLVIAYVLGMCAGGRARKILLAGFDGYGAADPRNIEMNKIFSQFMNTVGAPQVLSITPSLYQIPSTSIYAL
jgi:4-hydroxy 2-oxovalerate aldolase